MKHKIFLLTLFLLSLFAVSAYAEEEYSPVIGAPDKYPMSEPSERRAVGNDGHYYVIFRYDEMQSFGSIIEDEDGKDLFLVENGTNSASGISVLSDKYEIYLVSYNSDINHSFDDSDVIMNGELKVRKLNAEEYAVLDYGRLTDPVCIDFGDFCLIKCSCHDSDGIYDIYLDTYFNKVDPIEYIEEHSKNKPALVYNSDGSTTDAVEYIKAHGEGETSPDAAPDNISAADENTADSGMSAVFDTKIKVGIAVCAEALILLVLKNVFTKPKTK